MVSKGESLLEDQKRNDNVNDLPMYTRAVVAVTSVLPSIREGVLSGNLTTHLMEKVAKASNLASQALSELKKGAMFYKQVRWGSQEGMLVGFITALLLLVLVLNPEIRVGKATMEIVLSMVVQTIIGVASPFVDSWAKERIKHRENSGNTCELMVKIVSYIEHVLKMHWNDHDGLG